jgi:hypothetical protein
MPTNGRSHSLITGMRPTLGVNAERDCDFNQEPIFVDRSGRSYLTKFFLRLGYVLRSARVTPSGCSAHRAPRIAP